MEEVKDIVFFYLNLRVEKRKTTLWSNWAWPWSRQSCTETFFWKLPLPIKRDFKHIHLFLFEASKKVRIENQQRLKKALCAFWWAGKTYRKLSNLFLLIESFSYRQLAWQYPWIFCLWSSFPVKTCCELLFSSLKMPWTKPTH